MKSKPKDVHILRTAMQHGDRNYFVEFAGVDTRASAINCSQVVRHFNSKSTILCSFRIVFTSDFFKGTMVKVKGSEGHKNN